MGGVPCLTAQRRPGPEPRLHPDQLFANLFSTLRSTKAGAGTPATREPGRRRHGAEGRSTKAGAGTPATLAVSAAVATPVGAAQRRPGPEPRLHDTIQADHRAGEHAQRRPGPEPRLHAHWAPPSPSTWSTAQRRPGPEPRLHLRRGRESCARPGALNEGRGRNPGYTWHGAARPTRWKPLNEGRGRNPGYTGPRRRGRRASGTLNEGRGRNPGYTGRDSVRVRIPRQRSTKAGAGTPATHGQQRADVRPQFNPLNEGRGRNPGYTRSPAASDWPSPSLNEGRGRNPGYTRGSGARRAGMPSLNEGRGRNPGYTWPRGAGTRRHRPSLNEGRGRNPGYTGRPWRPARSSASLNEGRGRNPGYTARWRFVPRYVTDAQRRPGPEPRLHLLPVKPLVPVGTRSTKAGAGTPATQGGGGERVPPVVVAQRRPGPEPRLHNVSIDGNDLDVLAQRRPGPEPRLHLLATGERDLDDHPRSTKAGAGTPATRAYLDGRHGHQVRSTKAGAGTPATLLMCVASHRRCDFRTQLPTSARRYDNLFASHSVRTV